MTQAPSRSSSAASAANICTMPAFMSKAPGPVARSPSTANGHRGQSADRPNRVEMAHQKHARCAEAPSQVRAGRRLRASRHAPQGAEPRCRRAPSRRRTSRPDPSRGTRTRRVQPPCSSDALSSAVMSRTTGVGSPVNNRRGTRPPPETRAGSGTPLGTDNGSARSERPWRCCSGAATTGGGTGPGHRLRAG